MRKSLWIFILLTILQICSCKRASNPKVDQALTLAGSAPDSSLCILNSIDRRSLNEDDLAKYSLAYVWAQNKSGLDVSDDSLIRIAYHYYRDRTSPQTARALFYMGKYYTLVDSLEKANVCFYDAIVQSSCFSDIETEALATYKLSKNERFRSLTKAEELAARATELYTSINNIDTANLVYYMLNELTFAANNMNLDKAKKIGDKALQIAYTKGDSSIISAVHQEISFIYHKEGKNDSTFIHSKIAYLYSKQRDFSIQISLANGYLSVDSLAQAKDILINLNAGKSISRAYNRYYRLLMLANKERDYESALNYTDSALTCIEKMYHSALSSKEDYYTKLVEETEEKIEIRKAAAIRSILWCGVLFIVLLLLINTLYVLYLHRKNSEIKLNAEKEKNRVMLEYKEMQISIMRKYIEKKVLVLKKLSNIKENPHKNAILSEEDWNEIEVFLESSDNSFVSRLRRTYSELNEEDIRLLMLLRLNTTSKVMANIYNIEESSIRHKLALFKSKLGLYNSEESIRRFICKF